MTKQNVAIKQSSAEKDLVTHIGYDDFGRQEKEFLPYASTTDDGSIKPNAETATQQYYKNHYPDDFPGITDVNQINAYSQKNFENSPLNRVLQQAAPGKEWKLGNGHEIDFSYHTNGTNDVHLFKVEINTSTVSGSIKYTPSLVSANYYMPGTLYKTEIRDENHDGTNIKLHTTEEFKNKQGQVVLKRTHAIVPGTIKTDHDTYYVYDDFGNLTYVLPPKVKIEDGISDKELSELCYQYRYDGRNRLVEKKIPGKVEEYMVYDQLDRPVLTQDANLREENKWLFTKYDAFGRVIYSGIYTHNSKLDQPNMQNLFNTKNDTDVTYFEKRSPSPYNGAYYTNTNFPNSTIQVLSINYYDTYVDLPSGLTVPKIVYNQEVTTKTKGLGTVSKVRVLGTNQWITTVSCYDEKARPIYVYSYNDFLGTTDIVESKLDFTGKVEETKMTHRKLEQDDIVTIDTFEYDHAGRMLTQKQKINDQAIETIVTNTYDKLGQLVTKGVGGASGNLQTVDYGYNIRGWLKNINQDIKNDHDLFNFSIKYNDVTDMDKRLYNGNISQTSWNTLSVNDSDNPVSNQYVYSYDALNRISSAIDNTGRYNLQNVTYDKNGNILNLKRNGPVNADISAFGTMDELTYSYDHGNQLQKVTDTGSKTFGFKDGSNTDHDFAYDDNGNMIVDRNKGITNIVYNHLNLPTRVTINEKHIDYTYDASGIKLRKQVANTTTDYAGNYIYKNSGSGAVLEFFNQPEGYVSPDNTGKFHYTYQYKDHLGNVRLSYSDANGNGKIEVTDDPNTNEIVEESNYYPFGLKHKGYNNNISSLGNATAQKFGYNGIELEESLGLDLYEMDFRQYDPSIGRFNGIDPVTHYSMGTSVAFDNNPIFWADPSGADATSSIMDLFNNAGSGFTQYTNTGNGTFEETARASDEDIKNGKAILIAFPDQNPKIPSNQGAATWLEKTFGDGNGKVEGAGHAGIVLIDGDTGGTRYFDFGRYRRPDLGGLPEDTGAVRSSKNFSGLAIPDWDFNKTDEQNVSTIVTALHKSPVFKGYGTIMGALGEGLDFKAMLKYATEMEKKGYHPFGGYTSSTNSSNPSYCAKFARGCAEAGGFDWSWYVLTGKANVEDVNRVNQKGIKTIKD